MRRIRKGRIAERKRWLQSGRAAMKGENMANWIWYPGDFEIYHGMCQNFDREERAFSGRLLAYSGLPPSCGFPCVLPAGKGDGISGDSKGNRPRVGKMGGEGAVLVPGRTALLSGKKYTIGEWISCPAKEIGIDVVIGNRTGLPCIYVEGEVIRSGKNWTVTDFAAPEVPVGWNDMYVRHNRIPRYSNIRRNYAGLSPQNG